MGQKIKLNDKTYDVDNLNDQVKATLKLLKFANARMEELQNTQILMQRAKKSYMRSLKKEILSNKSGFLFSDD